MNTVQRCSAVFCAVLLTFSNSVFAEPNDSDSDDEAEENVSIAALLDDQATNDMHDDTTLLRNVSVLEDQTGLVFFDAMRIWLGGAVQYDYYNLDGIYNHSGDGDQREGASMRRLEGIFRSQLYDWGEIKAQYDFDKGVFRDLYLRWVSERAHTPTTVTIGNQKEPFGLDHLSGNKFGIAQERSAPSHAFGGWRSKGVRLHRAFQLAAEDRKLDIFEDDTAFITTSIGVFTEDIEETNDTDLAVTARVTGGTQSGNGGAHLGLAASYREGDFQRISFLPEVREADRIVLARPESNTLSILGLEGAFIRGPLQLQAEAHYGQYNGRVNGYGGGGYMQAAWLVTGGRRKYNPRWGTLAPYKPAGRYSVEVFARLSHTRGDDDIGGWNDFKAVTLGSSFFFRNLRCSINVLYGESREPIATEDSGLAVNVRAQYLF